MSFDNYYPNRKDHRSKYYDSRDVDRTCRSHGSCPWCKDNRLYKRRKMEEDLDYEDDGQPDDYTEFQDLAQDGYFENMTEEERL